MKSFQTVKKSLRHVVAVALAFALGGTALAFDESGEHEANIDYRKGVMASLGGNAAAIAAVVLDGADYGGNLARHVGYIVAITEELPDLFPEGSGAGETGALPAVWEDWETFTERARKNNEAARALLAAVEAGDDNVALKFREMGQSCRGCHEDFRRRD